MTGDARVVSLWDALEHPDWCPIADMTVTKIGTRDVQEFTRRWHYAKHGGAMAWSYGIWDGVTLAGVVSYNTPTLTAQTAVFGPELAATVLHMGRLVCAETAPRNTESRLIALSLRLLLRDVPTARAVLTYAASGERHVGYIYQATNALYLGMSASTHYYRDQLGQRRARKQNGGPNKNGNIPPAELKARGWVKHTEPGKHRYIYLLGNKTQRRESLRLLRHTPQPYPKGDTP